MAVAANKLTNWLTLTRQTGRVDPIWVGRYGRYYPDRADPPISERCDITRGCNGRICRELIYANTIVEPLPNRWPVCYTK